MTKVTINVFDQDVVSVNGNTPESTVVTSRRWNGYFNIGTDANLDEYYFTRYFPKSGTYRFKLGHRVNNLDGILEMGVNKSEDTKNNTNIFSGLDLYASPQVNLSESFATVKVARGFNNINFKINGKNSSSSNYDLYWYICEFDLINEHPVLEEATASPRNGMELLASVDVTTGTTISTGNFTAKKLLCVEFYLDASAISFDWQFNSSTDTQTSTYSGRHQNNGIGASGQNSDYTQINKNVMAENFGLNASPHFGNMFIVNNASNEKLVTGHLVNQNTAGAGNSPNRAEFAYKWANTTNQINNITMLNSVNVSRFIMKVWGMD